MINELIPDENYVVVICSKCGKGFLQLRMCYQVMFNPPMCSRCAAKQSLANIGFQEYQMLNKKD